MKNDQAKKVPSRLSAESGNETALQTIWSGTVSFSLVAIPVQLVRAIEPGRVSFRMLHNKDYSPLLRRMFCPEEGKIVPPDEIIRGYEIGPEKYILITDEELESLTPERSRTIEIIEFIDMKDVDTIYYDHPYYLVPSKGGEKAYQLLVEVMDRTHKAGLAKFVLGEREYLVAVKSTQRALCLVTLHYTEEILPDKDIQPETEEETEPKEIDLMKKVIKEMTSRFNPDKYADERRKKISKLLDRKMKSGTAVEAPGVEQEEGGGPVDLIKVLEESMRKVKKNR
jgi:DNA end-binding protein Ku